MKRRGFLNALFVCTFTLMSGNLKAETVNHKDPNGYYTCSMHPQVHEHKPGKCPICGMPLILVYAKSQIKKDPALQSEGIQISETQKKYAQVSKYTVSKKDLVLSIPASGRVLSGREIAFQVYESDLDMVKSSALFSGSSSSSTNKILKGRISSVDRLVDPSSRTLRAVGILDQSANLIAESAFHGEITTTLKNQIVIPIESVLHAGTRDLVYIFSKEGYLAPRAVQLGSKGKEEYQVLSGLEEGDIISTGPNFLLDSEAKLRGY